MCGTRSCGGSLSRRINLQWKVAPRSLIFKQVSIRTDRCSTMGRSQHRRLQMPRIMFLDLEVENNPYYGQIASPLHEDNYVVAVGWALDEQPYSGEVQHTYYPNKHEATYRWDN